MQAVGSIGLPSRTNQLAKRSRAAYRSVIPRAEASADRRLTAVRRTITRRTMTTAVENLTIVHYPHPALRRKAEEIAEVTDEVRAVARRMIELMHEAEGVGLAAPQVALSWRIFVTNSRQEGDEDRVYINPVLREPGGEWEVHEEGCLSLPEIVGDVRRPTVMTVDAIDLDGKPFSMTAEGFLARIWQHEFDHLNGTLIIDRFTQMSKLANRKSVKQLEKNADD